MAEKKKKLRAEFRKNRSVRARQRDWTEPFDRDSTNLDHLPRGERVSGKGELSRKRTVVGTATEGESTGFAVSPDADSTACLRGRVLAVHGLSSVVEAADGAVYRCVTRGLLKTLSTDQRHVVAAGDYVLFRPIDSGEGIIERIEPRRAVLSRTSRGRQHILVTNVDQVVIVTSAAEPVIKPNLIDRMLVTAHHTRLRPIICVNKVDLVDPAGLMPLVGVFSQMGYPVLLASAATGQGIDRLRAALRGRSSVVAGQSGVGKSSLLNAVDPALGLLVREVSETTQKGRHTTTTARLWPLAFGGYVVDTPGIRQFQLWDVIGAEVAGYFRDLRPYVNRCKYPNCTHTHEDECAVKNAVADGRLDLRRYDGYCSLFRGEESPG